MQRDRWTAILGGLCALALGCSNGPPATPGGGGATTAAPEVTNPTWRSEVLLDTGSKLSGVVVADFVPSSTGNELLAVGTDHRWHLCRAGESGWSSEAIAQTPGEMIQIAAGDIWLRGDGTAEAVAVGVAAGNEDDPGAKGAAVLLRRNDDDSAWITEQIFEDSALLHGVAIVGEHVWVTGYSRRVHRLTRTAEGAWVALTADLPGPGRSIAPSALGGSVIVACKDGSLVLVRAEGDTLKVTGLDKRNSGRARVGTAGTTGPGATVVCDDDGTFTLRGSGESTVLYKADQKLRGAVVADLDPDSPGWEAATAGYDGTMRLFRQGPGGWIGTIVATDSDRFHHLTSGTLAGWTGIVLVGVNYSGRVTVAGRK